MWRREFTTMNQIKKVAAVALFAGLLMPASTLLAQGPPPPGYGQRYGQGPGYGQGGWDAPPPDFNRDIQRRGFRDGIEGARRDAENHRSINVMNRDEYRNYRGPDRRAYRQAFERGYQAFWSHDRGGPGGPGGPRPY